MKHKLITAVIAALFLISVSSAFAVDNPSISGIWILDKAKSQGLPPGLDQQIMTIMQTATRFR